MVAAARTGRPKLGLATRQRALAPTQASAGAEMDGLIPTGASEPMKGAHAPTRTVALGLGSHITLVSRLE